MKTRTAPTLLARRQHAASRRGVALLLVLGCLVLLTTLILAFLISGQSNLKSSKLYANGSSVKTLADSTVNIVMAQIQQATSNGTTVAWASQPGMIRTYGNDGKPLLNYRLFSWDSPVTTGAYDASTDQTVISSSVSSSNLWYSNPALFVDLNKPVVDSASHLQYPIIDGNPTDIPTAPNYPIASPAVSTYTYTTGTTTLPTVEGFWVNQQNTATGPAVSTSTTTTPNNIPMPVKWLYVLQNGTVVAPQATINNSIVNVNAATASNPIVGRIAYWTDDETSKININTASEGIYWDTPRADSTFDKNNLAEDQPAQNEFQRYPGHPATTSLSTVLGSIFTMTYPPSATSPYYTASQYLPYHALSPKSNVGSTSQTTNLGSNAGTATPVNNLGTSTVAGTGALSFKNDRLFTSVDELAFSSDLPNGLPSSLPGNAGVTATSSYSRPVTSIGGANTITSPFLGKARFFLTTSSRAPDVNLFNQPRIGIWPINANNSTTTRTVLDNTIAFCGKVGGLPYYFQRGNAYSATADLPASTYVPGATDITRNRALMTYMQNLTSTAIPGFGGTFTGKYTTNERDQILTEMFDYVRSQNLIDPNVITPFSTIPPSFGSDYLSAPVATSLTTNCGLGQVVPITDSLGAGGTGTRGFGRFPTITEATLMFIVLGWNDNSGGAPSTTDPNYYTPSGTSTIPAVIPTTWTAHLSNFGCPWGYYGGKSASPAIAPVNCWNFAGGPGSPGTMVATAIAPGHVRVQAALILSMFDPSQGYPSNNGCYQIQISGLDSWTWNGGAKMGFPAVANALTGWPTCSGNAYGYNQEKWGGVLDFRTMALKMSPTSTKGTVNYYPFFSNSIDLPYTPGSPASFTGTSYPSQANPTPIVFNGGASSTNPITINMCIPTSTAWTPGTVVQTIKLNFPGGTFPCPTYAGAVCDLADGSSTADQNNTYDMGRWDQRFGQGTAPYSPQSFLVNTRDVARSVRFNTDARLIAGLQTVDASSTSAANTSYYTSYTGSESASLMHSMWLSIGMPLYAASFGQLVNGLTYTAYTNPWNSNLGNVGTFLSAGYCATQGAFQYAAGTPPTVTTNLGDWDNGVGVTGDGPYINKADEGDFQYWDPSGNGGSGAATVPYYGDWYSLHALTSSGQTFFSPNRLIPSPVVFGSLPTGVKRGLPWQTLLFNPNPAAGSAHPGFGVGNGTVGANDVPPYTSPPDHLFLDLFNMPVVEPYPISEPLSTAGRVNMNYQIVPFTYIERSTGVRAVLKSERITAIPDTDAGTYKNLSGTTVGYTANNYRLPINLDQTLLAFDNYFATNKDIFRSASQICNISLVPTIDAGGGAITLPFVPATFWATHRLTGDNAREKPYADIYPRLTTKSNTYTVHYYVQTLQKVTGSLATQWNETTDQITGEYRGSTTIERYVNPSDSSLPDFTSATTTALDKWYKFRVINTKQFAP